MAIVDTWGAGSPPAPDLLGTTQAQAAAFTDAQLDADYAAKFAAGDVQSYTYDQWEIANRVQGSIGFIESAVGYSNFPLYDAIQKQLGRTTAIDNARSSIADSAKTVGIGIGLGTGALALLALGFGLLILTRR